MGIGFICGAGPSAGFVTTPGIPSCGFITTGGGAATTADPPSWILVATPATITWNRGIRINILRV